jgi:uncharacterized membrane protein HdeD (DUF308 family)
MTASEPSNAHRQRPSRWSPFSLTGGDDNRNAVLARNWWAFALRGVLAILFGLIAIIVPGAAMLTLALFFAAYLIVDGVFGIIAAVRAAQANERWGWLIAEGVLNLIIGAIAFFFPASAVLAFVFVTAAWAIITGALMLAAAFQVNPALGRWWLALGGIVSIVFGGLLILAPLIGAVVLTWWLGGYAIAFGVMLLIFAFRLRGRTPPGGPRHSRDVPSSASRTG